MANEEAIVSELKEKFPFLAEKLFVKRARRVYAVAPYENFAEVFAHLVKKMDFQTLDTITGTDEEEGFGVIYHLGRPDGTLVNLKTYVSKEKPVVNTVSDYFPGCVLYERELVDLFGFEVKGLPEFGNRYPLQDDWPKGQYPLRKDWSPDMLDEYDKAKK